MILTINPGKDRRIQKTQRLLREALAYLIREKPYNSIAVKQILDYANVGRSTFYAHFRDKDNSRETIHQHLRAVLAQLIVEHIRNRCPGESRTRRQIAPDLLAQHVASTFILVLDWWVGSSRLPPKEANNVFVR